MERRASGRKKEIEETFDQQDVTSCKMNDGRKDERWRKNTDGPTVSVLKYGNGQHKLVDISFNRKDIYQRRH